MAFITQENIRLPVALLTIALGSFISITGLNNLHLATQSYSWDIARGTITKSRVNSIHTTGSKPQISYEAEIEYAFSVDSIQYKGTTVWYGDFSASSSSRASRIVKTYPVGSKVDVSYSSSKPENNVLEPGIKWFTFLLPLAGLIFLTVGIVFLRDELKKFSFFSGFFSAKQQDP